jgi:hypothetical protein
MGKLETASPGFALKLGLFVVHRDAHRHLDHAGRQWLPLDTRRVTRKGDPVLPADGPIDWLSAAGAPGNGPSSGDNLPKVRNWMNTNSWVVSEIVILFFLVLELKDALTG